ncbi:hypothetical protein H5968_16085 [Sphaerospermopsis sp. LEGE 00249]|uniref:hypothetical protein n=1 Tax=Sphaerospermopsis sp. LEGE 00249 TaxID=1380707 RepID=UPI00164EBC03|nr:hypothetical protein [Sphaerospermopsis sp. LEGE 00249]MBC5796626.1 hypothetical protein [Sphaerospermopsis sp. LEGE 00249]
MVTISNSLFNLSLADAKPTDSPHLLLWDNPHDASIHKLTFNNNAEIISYRDDLLNRVNLQQKFLILHQNLDQEIDAIRQICANTNNSSKYNNQRVLLLKDLDILITYLYSKPSSPISLLWQKLGDMRHLESILWILLPTQIHPINWNKKRIITIV